MEAVSEVWRETSVCVPPVGVRDPGSVASFFSRVFDTSDFPARWDCGNFTLLHGWTHIISDLAIWGAYMSIPVVLAWFLLRRRDVPFPRVFWLFVAFIFACATTHLVEAIIFWEPLYRVSALLKVATALVSWMTVVALVPVIPKAMTIPGIAKMNKRLAEDNAVRRQAEQRLQEVNDALEARGREIELFTYSVSHDLKSPLITIAGMIGLAEGELGSGPEGDPAREHLAVAQRTVGHMDAVLDDLLALAQVGRGPAVRERFSLERCVLGAVEGVRGECERVGAEVRVVGPIGDALGRASEVRRAIGNLLVNAVRHGASRARADRSI